MGRRKSYLFTRTQEKLIAKSIRFIFKLAGKSLYMLFLIAMTILRAAAEGTYYIFRYVKNYRKAKKCGYSYNELEKIIREMQPRQFEIFCAELFKALGYFVELTPAGGDYGRDLVLNSEIFVECKHYAENNYIGRVEVQKLLGSCRQFGVEKAIFINTGSYHQNAYEVERMVDSLELWDMSDILKKLLAISPERIPHIIIRSTNIFNNRELNPCN
ncbi:MULTISPECIES: restriction endonuclease [unclassified Clostridium]|uniref:restriction endonuclease n=1 Tax=unclassified Clostridium TaxID=2614128 RepID=UPI0025C5DD57|nr:MULTISPECIES: restriction endonuclease [unclassified Clostridium]